MGTLIVAVTAFLILIQMQGLRSDGLRTPSGIRTQTIVNAIIT